MDPHPVGGQTMRFLRFEDQGPRDAVLMDAERCIDLAAAGRASDAAPWQDPEDRGLLRIARAKPPAHAVRRVDRVRLLPPCTPGRVVLHGGMEDDFAPSVAAPGAALPAGAWSTGVVAVLRHRPPAAPTRHKWLEHVAGFAPFQRVQDSLCFGPWIVGTDEVRDPLRLAFSAFVDDLPRIRPAKALLDWGAVLAEAHAKKPLDAGDLVGLAAPPQDVEAGMHLRAALVYDGGVVARLLNLVGPGGVPGGDAQAGPEGTGPADPVDPDRAATA